MLRPVIAAPCLYLLPIVALIVTLEKGPFESEASKGGMKVGGMKDPLYKDSHIIGITPPTFIPPLEPFD